MNIRKFKEEDLVTRNEPLVYEHNGMKDGSYLGEKMQYVGIDEESKTLFFKFRDYKEGKSFSFARDRWDEGWAAYPLELEQKSGQLL